MFIYSFKTQGNYLIKHIVVIGQFVTFFVTKPDEDDSPELSVILDKLHVIGVSGDSPTHSFLHNPYVDFLQDNDSADNKAPHRHAHFPEHVRLENILNALLLHQQSPGDRTKALTDFSSNLDSRRIKAGHAKLPDNIQRQISNYDTETPFIPVDEVKNILNQYKLYLSTRDAILFSEQVSIYIIQFISKHHTLLLGDPWNNVRGVLADYQDNIGSEEKVKQNFESVPLLCRLTEPQQFLSDYFGNLCLLRKTLLAMHYEKDEEKISVCCSHAIQLLSEIKQSPCHSKLAVGFNLTEISNFLAQKQLQGSNEMKDQNPQKEDADLFQVIKHAISDARTQYTQNFKSKKYHGLFHHHGDTGQYRSLAFYGRSSRWRTLETGVKDLATFFSRKESGIFNKRGNLHDHSFDTLLLQSLIKNEKFVSDFKLPNLSLKNKADRFQLRETIITQCKALSKK